MTSAPERWSTDDATMLDRIHRYLRQRGLEHDQVTIVPLTGDASDRRYFRILPPDGQPTLVLALHTEPIEFATLPFVNVARLLAIIALPVPRVLGHSDALGILALDDLGDLTLQAHLGAATAAEHSALYRQAIAFLELLQRRGAEIDPDGFMPYGIAFDVEKLTWELDFFLKHFVAGYRGASITSAQRSAFDREFDAIATELAGEPRVLCHRDYHSRNLMLHAGTLHIIDFQDARMGPDTYDLASLLRDSYVDLDEAEIGDLIAYFLALKGQSSDPGGEFRRRFDLIALQRNLKALGTFGFQTMARRNPVYIQYMPRTLRYVHGNLAKYPRFERLRELLAEHLDELR
jgi:aminoglycoside/choline kinase family phosphotransferase